jgi:hypothetical protein
MDTFPDSGSGGTKQINWRQFGKHWIVVFILAILAAFVIWGMLNSGPWLRRLQDWRAARALQSEVEKVYRNDKYGGKTPEETFDMFIAALEKGDVELASKYFVIEKQESWRQSLATIKSQSAIYDEMLTEMRFARDNANKKVEGGFAWFSYIMPSEEIGAQLVFEKILTRWKIYNL